MTKTTLKIFVLSFLLCGNYQAQSADSSSINVRALLNKQISEIRARQENQTANIINLSNANMEDGIVEIIKNDIAVKIYVVIEIIMLLGLIYMWLTKAKKMKKEKIDMLKSNIKNLREERIGSLGENNLSALRGRLRYDRIKTDDNGKDITFRARKNNIGKGEIHLAAKIQLLAGEYK